MEVVKFLTIVRPLLADTKKGSQTHVEFVTLFVIRLGFEPKTHSLEGCCSIQLSYRTVIWQTGKRRAFSGAVAKIAIYSEPENFLYPAKEISMAIR